MENKKQNKTMKKIKDTMISTKNKVVSKMKGAKNKIKTYFVSLKEKNKTRKAHARSVKHLNSKKIIKTVSKVNSPEIQKKFLMTAPITKANFFKSLKWTNSVENWYDDNFNDLVEIFKKHPIASQKEPMFILRDISKTYTTPKTSSLIFRDVNLKIKQGEVVSFVGANGAGKSTLMDIIAGFKHPTTGEVRFGFKFQNAPTEKIGVSYQKTLFLDTLTVWDYIQFTKNIYHSKINLFQLLMFVHAFGLEQFCKSKVNSMSGGQQQRLNIMLSLFHSPQILLFDELCNNLDINIREKIVKFVSTYINARNVTGIIISHDPKEIDSLATRVILLKNQTVALDEPKEKLLAEWKTMGRFLEKNI